MFWHLSQVWVALIWLICYLFPHNHNNVHFCKFLVPVRELVTSLHQHLSLYSHTVLRSAGWKARYWVQESSPGWGSACSLVFSCPYHFPQSSPVSPGSPNIASLGMKLSKGVCSVPGAPAPRCPRTMGRCAAAANPLCCPSPAAAGTPQRSSALLAQISFSGKTGYKRRGRGAERASGSSWHGGDKHKHVHLQGSAPGSHAVCTRPSAEPPGTGTRDRAPKFGTCVLAWGQQRKHPFSSSLPAPRFWIMVSPVQVADDLKGACPQFAKQHHCVHWAQQLSQSPMKGVQQKKSNSLPHLKKFNKLAWGNQRLACSHARCHLFKVHAMPESGYTV